MIYQPADESAPLRQGDIFVNLPRVDVSMDSILLVDEDGERVAKWDELYSRSEPMKAIVPIRLRRAELEGLRNLRPARLNDVADEHFRERISQFFRRYPYDEWYALERDEMALYKNEYPDAEPFPWQEPASVGSE